MFAGYLLVHIHILMSTWQTDICQIPFPVYGTHNLYGLSALPVLCFVLLILFIFWIGDRCTWYKIPKVQEFTVKSKSPCFLLQ